MHGTTRPSSEVTRDWIRALETTKRLLQEPCPGLPAIVRSQAENEPGRVALIGKDGTWTYAELAGRANQYSRWALRQGLLAGDAVGLLMSNQPEYVAVWLGLAQVGCVTALLNPQLASAGLTHALDSASVRAVIAESSIPCSREPEGGRPDRPWWEHGGSRGLARIDTAVAALPSDPLTPEERRPAALRAPALLVFTSGTTGHPKAVKITHARTLEWSGWFAGVMNATAGDRLYNCLPMFHSVGGIAALGAMMVAGGSTVIRERFSASRFWPDVAESGATIFQYIGELCRYLVQADACDEERRHRLRLACGNGLRADVWTRFQQRFQIPQVLEFYAASEGCIALTNAEGKVGSVGRVPRFLAHRYPLALVRLDAASEQPERGADGHCIRCGTGEPGELIGRVDGSTLRFDGYTDTAATQARYLRDVFGSGDRWFRSGDLMEQDSAGYYYFLDRLGDTYRYKGENVSTTEVAAALQSCAGVVDAIAYGVSLPGVEGKAGMAALVVGNEFAFSGLCAHLATCLPAYARPLFIRICGSLDATATFRLRKTDYARQGYEAGSDPVWFFDANSGDYVPCDVHLARKISARSLKL